jgi:hypothetical protein
MAPSNTSNMARAKADASSTPNTPSSIKLSPLTYFSQAAGFWYNITHSPMTASPRKIEVEVGNSPKSNSPASASTEIKKGKVKTRGTVNACAPPMTTYWIQLDDAPEGKYRTKIRPSPGNNDPNPNPNPNTTQPKPKPEYDPDTPYRCIICDNEIPKAERQRHFVGRPHGQTFGMLEDFKRRYVLKEKDLPNPDSGLLRVNRNEWRCPPCGGSMPYPHRARTMQDHLVVAPSHRAAMESLWVAFVKHMRSAFGLRDDEIPEFPQHLEDTIPQKPRDDGN